VLNKFLMALSFLTVLPLKVKKINEKEIASSVIFFPFVGFLEGVFSFLLIKKLNYIFSSSVISVILLLFSLRGIFHIDGLSDTFDALFYKETGDKEKDMQRRLEIMSDSTIGVAGVVASTFDILCRFVFFRELIDGNQFMIFIFTFVFSRWSVIPLMYYGKPAKTKGLGAMFVGKISKEQFILSTALPVFLVIYFTVKSFIFLPLIVLLLCLILFILKNFFEDKFSGITGDHLGATVELTEVVFLFCFLLCARIWLSY